MRPFFCVRRLAWAAVSLLAVAPCGALAMQAPTPAATGPEAPKPVPTLTKCPDNAGAYVDSHVSASFVVKCMGKPQSENHNPDGRYVYMYSLKGGTMIGFLFDHDGVLIRPVAYRHD